MAESTEFHGDIAAPAGAAGTSALHALGRTLRRIFARAVFWHYERGSWQYDAICAVILAFIFLPRSWFHDRPQLQLSDLRHVQGVVEVSHLRNEHTYQVDSRLVESVMQDRSMSAEKPEDAIRAILQRRVKGLSNVKSLEPIRDKNHVILGYTVVIEQ
jgi:hypothetical protein